MKIPSQQALQPSHPCVKPRSPLASFWPLVVAQHLPAADQCNNSGGGGSGSSGRGGGVGEGGETARAEVVVAPTMEELSAPSQGNHHNGGAGGGATGAGASGTGPPPQLAGQGAGGGGPGMMGAPSTAGGGAGGGGMMGKGNNHDEGMQRTQYSIPGILHFIQHEWARFEVDRSQWEVERAELQARIAFLQGERKGQENLKNDLIRRIKMLEYALKQERAKYHKLKYGTELQQGDMKPVGFEDTEQPMDGESPITVSNVTWRQGRQLLRQYLQEIGYTDTIIDVRSNRVRSLLGLNNNAENEENQNNATGVLNGNETANKRAGDTQGRRTPAKKAPPSSLAEAMMLDAEAAVMANFEFLSQTVVEVDDEDEMSDDLEEAAEEEAAAAAAAAAVEVEAKKRKGGGKMGMMSNEGLADDVDAETEEVLNEFNFLGSEGEDTVHDGRMAGDGSGWGLTGGYSTPRHLTGSGGSGDEEGMDAALGLGELAQLTVNNEAEISYDQISASKEAFRKTWNAKYTLRSHFDGVRALAFHPVEPVLISASEDHTLKLWNLHKTVPAKKSASLDVEPLYTFRAHVGAVLCLAMNATGEQCYSGGVDGAIRCWNIPNSNVDPYDSFDPGVLTGTLTGHTDSVWGLSIHSHKLHVLSCSADGTVRLWEPQKPKSPLLKTFAAEQEGIPTSVDFVRDEPNHMVTSYNSSHCIIYDLETGKPVTCLESSQEADNNVVGHQINRVVSHPTLPVTITAHEDRHIRFFDNISGKMVHSMVAHLDAVTSLAVDPNGLYLLSGSHDCSIRLWNLENKTCVQEITAHRKKFDESIFDVAFHPSKPYIASAGADGLAKVFV